MKLSRLKELRPDVWEEAKRQCVKLTGLRNWEDCINKDVQLSDLFTWADSDQKLDVWDRIEFYKDFTLYDQWLAIQTKQPEPQSKIDLEYWRWKFAGMAMQGILSSGLYGIEKNFKYLGHPEEMIGRCEEAVMWADTLIAELQKEKA